MNTCTEKCMSNTRSTCMSNSKSKVVVQQNVLEYEYEYYISECYNEVCYIQNRIWIKMYARFDFPVKLMYTHEHNRGLIPRVSMVLEKLGMGLSLIMRSINHYAKTIFCQVQKAGHSEVGHCNVYTCTYVSKGESYGNNCFTLHQRSRLLIQSSKINCDLTFIKAMTY